jgi:hypothetical protein
MQDGYRASANSIGNKPGTQHLDVEFKNDGMDFTIHAREGASTPQTVRVKHAANDGEDDVITVEITGKIKRDATGHIVGFEFDHLKPKTVKHIAESGEEFLMHYGVKGMRWGVTRSKAMRAKADRLHAEADRMESTAAGARGATRARALKENANKKRAQGDALRAAADKHDQKNAPPTTVAPSATSVVPRGSLRKTKIQTEGGENHPAHEDAIKVAQAQAKLKKSGTAALSNKELQDLQTRMNLERNVTTLVKDRTRVGKGRKFVRELTGFNREFNTTVETGINSARLARQVRTA